MKCVFFILIMFGFAACSSNPTTGLNERGTHTGTLALLRVDDSWAPDHLPLPAGVTFTKDQLREFSENSTNWRGAQIEGIPATYQATNDIHTETYRCERRVGTDPSHCDPVRRFVPVRHKDDVEGLDNPASVVRASQKAVITINYSFIKYFKEFGDEKRQGEIAMILSFESGEAKRDSFLVYSSEGQTLGSFLGAQDWKAIGPIEIDGPALSIRMVIIEIDQIENERLKQYIRTAATTVATVAPTAGAVVPIATSVSDFIIGQNTDDVVLDQRFTLTRYDENAQFHASPLLYGKYILMSQEDRLASTGAAKAARFSTLPPEVDRFRYDLKSDRLFLEYTYQVPVDPFLKTPKSNHKVPINGANYFDPNEFGPIREPHFHSSRDVSDVYSQCSLETLNAALKAAMKGRKGGKGGAAISGSNYGTARDINTATAKNIRRRTLGYRFDGGVAPASGTFCSLERALAQVVIDAARYTGDIEPKANIEPDLQLLETALDGAGGKFGFDYPVERYPRAQSLLAQYPFHTHVVFSIDRVYGEGGSPYHEGFPDYQTYLEKEIEAARSNTELDTITQTLSKSIAALKQRKLAFEHLKALPDDASAKDKVCVLFNALQPTDSATSLSNAEILDEIRIVSGRFFSEPEKVKDYLNDASDGGTKNADNSNGFECFNS